MVSKELQKKIDQAIHLLQSVQRGYDGQIEIAYSGGKDSDVILQLAKEAGINYRAIYKNTTIDPPGTIAHVKKMGVEIRRPKISFFQLVAKKSLPSRFSRFCCAELKEYKILDKCIIGVRKAESTKRASIYSEPTRCVYYGRAKTEANHVEVIFPILEWTNDDVRDFILDRHITLASIYYDGGGNLDVSKRLGCMGCPLASEKKRIASFKEHPKMVRCYLRSLQKFWDLHPDATCHKKYDDIYECFTRDVFYPRQSEWDRVSNGMFGKPDFKHFLEQQFGINLTL